MKNKKEPLTQIGAYLVYVTIWVGGSAAVILLMSIIHSNGDIEIKSEKKPLKQQP